MRFLRMPVVQVKGITPRRLSAARRRLQRKRDSWALFPEYWPQQSAEEDILDVDRRQLEGELAHRKQRADDWKRLRRLVRQHQQGVDILRYWQTCNYPGTPEYLAGLIRKASLDSSWIAKQEASIERQRQTGELMRQAMGEVDGQRPGESYKDVFFRRLSEVNKKLGLVSAPFSLKST